MTIRISSGLRNHIMQHGSLKNALHGGKLMIYTGGQPATADAAPTGTLLATITGASLAHTAEVKASGTVTLATGASGSVNTVTVNSINLIPNGAVAFNTSLTQTATDLAAAINEGQSSPEYTAESSGAVVTIYAMRGAGTSANGLVVTATLTTITATYANMSGGVASVNGLRFGNAAAGLVAKDATQTWTGVAAASGIAGYARFVGAVADSGIADAVEAQIRLDGSVAVSGGDIAMGNTTVQSGATQTIASFSVNIPAS
jgi:hypothetical protein